ncbi:MAG: hypothetical protein IT371_22875 [Deltaproteobacteria bacterium]|nr:hypothetical protein [Deltaproteobacteria bacterium]
MSESETPSWTSWSALSETTRRVLLARATLWSELSADQREALLAQADWQELRLVPQARAEKLARLVSVEETCADLGVIPTELFWLMSTRQLAGWLVEGVWRFDRGQVARWVEERGGPDEVRRDVRAQMAEHRAAQLAPSGAKG